MIHHLTWISNINNPFIEFRQATYWHSINQPDVARRAAALEVRDGAKLPKAPARAQRGGEAKGSGEAKGGAKALRRSESSSASAVWPHLRHMEADSGLAQAITRVSVAVTR
jgi:hypothetical protein